MAVLEALAKAKESGYEAYKVGDYTSFGYVITPRGNVLGVSEATFNRGGVTFSFEYKPSRINGRGCSCMETTDEQDLGISPQKLNADTLKQFEDNGLTFARELRAQLYKNVDEWKADSYWKSKLERM